MTTRISATTAPRGTRRGLILLSLILSMGLAALDSTIVSTALPTIVGELGGFAQFSWVFSLYLLTQTAAIPIYGRLADMYGRKPTLIFSIILFMTGSVLCGLSQSMTALIVFRALQGIGAGGLIPVAQTVVGDIYTLEQRARMQGLISSVWAISAVLGPLLGGVLVHFSWRLVFYVNVPLTIIALVLFTTEYHEDPTHAHHRQTLDIPGSILLVVWVTSLILGLLQGQSWGYESAPTLITFLVAGLGIVAFFLWEARASQPILALSLLRIPIIGAGNVASLLSGGLLIGLTGFIPTFVQGVLGGSPTVAGLVLTSMSVGWPLASAAAGRSILRFGGKVTAVMGGALAALGTLWMLSLNGSSQIWSIAPRSFIVGAGLGFVTTTALVLIQEVVPRRERGAATGSNLFARMLGSTIFIGVMGAVLNSYLEAHVGGGSEAVSRLLGAISSGTIRGSTFRGVQGALSGGLHEVFLVSFSLAILALIATTFMPRRVQSALE